VRLHNISRGTYVKLRREGRGPDEMHVGAATGISVEAAARWRKVMERSPIAHRRGAAAAEARRAKTTGNGRDDAVTP
jgi:hypothetical protein